MLSKGNNTLDNILLFSFSSLSAACVYVGLFVCSSRKYNRYILQIHVKLLKINTSLVKLCAFEYQLISYVDDVAATLQDLKDVSTNLSNLKL